MTYDYGDDLLHFASVLLVIYIGKEETSKMKRQTEMFRN